MTSARTVLALASLLALGVLAASCGHDAPRRNVLLVTLDTTRADALSCYGAPAGSTPNLDALAKEGARFELAISTAAVTPVSHASILTGLENMEHGVRVLSAGSGFRLGDDVPTLATVLKKAGWSTAAVHSAFPVSAYFGFKRGFDVFESFDGEMTKREKGDMWDVASLQRRSDETTERVLDALAKSKEPWFCWIHYWDPHDDVRVPPDAEIPASVPRLPDGRPMASRELYASEVRYVDEQLGRVIARLKERGEWDDTIVVVVADHGEGLGDHGWLHHRVLWQEQIRVPLLVRVPGVAHREIPELVRTTDIYPTVLDYLGIAQPRRTSGRTLRALLEGNHDAPRTAYADQINGYDKNAGLVRNRPHDAFLYAIVEREWKLVWRPEFPEQSELYHLAVDPRETTNLFLDPRHAERVKALADELAARKGWVVEPFPVVAGGTSASAQAVLDQTGYVGGDTSDLHATDWSWTCALHRAWRSEERARCPTCGALPLLVRRAP